MLQFRRPIRPPSAKFPVVRPVRQRSHQTCSPPTAAHANNMRRARRACRVAPVAAVKKPSPNASLSHAELLAKRARQLRNTQACRARQRAKAELEKSRWVAAAAARKLKREEEQRTTKQAGAFPAAFFPSRVFARC